MTETIVESWGELQEKLYDGSFNENLGRYRSPYVFRGLADKEYDLKTSLIRLLESEDGQTVRSDYENLESHLLRNFSKYAHREAPNQSVWHLLAVAQHHGLPTRLLDWTYSPLVATHFATSNVEKFDTPGVIWKVNHKKARERLPRELRQVLTQEQSAVFTVDMLEESIPTILERREQTAQSDHQVSLSEIYTKPEHEPLSFPSVRDSLEQFDQLGDFVVFFEPPSLDERIVNQSGLFSVMSDPTVKLDSWLESNDDIWEKIIIPAGCKPQFRDYLDQANITERVLFPGLDGLADWLTRYYTPKHKWKSYAEEE